MILYAYLVAIAFACIVTLCRWRLGPYLLVAVGLLADPVRKGVPGTPAWLVLACLPVWGCMVLAAAAQGALHPRSIRQRLPFLTGTAAFFLLTSIPAFVLALTYSPTSWLIAALGTFSYAAVLLGLLAGYSYPRAPADLRRFLGFYCIAAGALLAGTLLEQRGVTWSILGSQALGDVWVTYREDDPVYMLAGFFRSPDVMGWHAAAVTVLSGTLALSARRSRRWLWLLLGAWALVAAYLSGRRKMLSIVILAAALLPLLLMQTRHRWRALLALLAAVALGAGALRLANTLTSDEALSRFQVSAAVEVIPRFVQQGVDATLVTYDQSGFFGLGIGMANQGARHITDDRPRAWQEGGLSKLMAELGVPGTCAVLLLAIALALAYAAALRRLRGMPEFTLFAGLAAFLAANALGAVVSAHVFADFLILLFITFLSGLALSAHRIKPDPAARP